MNEETTFKDKAKGSASKLAWVVVTALVTSFIAVPSTYFITEYCFPAKLPADYIAIHEPKIVASLVVDEVTPKGIRYHYKLRNEGRIKANNVNCTESTASKKVAHDSLQRREIAPGDTMRLQVVYCDPDMLPLTPFVRAKLYVFSDAVISSVTNGYRSYFYFDIMREDIEEGEYSPSITTRHEGAINQFERYKRLFGDGLCPTTN